MLKWKGVTLLPRPRDHLQPLPNLESHLCQVFWGCLWKKNLQGSQPFFLRQPSGSFLKWWYPHFTPQNGPFLVGKPIVVGYPILRKHPSIFTTGVYLFGETCHLFRKFQKFVVLPHHVFSSNIERKNHSGKNWSQMNFPEITTALKDYPHSQSLFPPKPRPKRDSWALRNSIESALMSRGGKNRSTHLPWRQRVSFTKNHVFPGCSVDFLGAVAKGKKDGRKSQLVKFDQMKLQWMLHMDVSKNSGTPKSSILIGFSIIFTIHFGVPLFFGNTHIRLQSSQKCPQICRTSKVIHCLKRSAWCAA